MLNGPKVKFSVGRSKYDPMTNEGIVIDSKYATPSEPFDSVLVLVTKLDEKDDCSKGHVKEGKVWLVSGEYEVIEATS
jgi:hypothetical protein